MLSNLKRLVSFCNEQHKTIYNDPASCPSHSLTYYPFWDCPIGTRVNLYHHRVDVLGSNLGGRDKNWWRIRWTKAFSKHIICKWTAWTRGPGPYKKNRECPIGIMIQLMSLIMQKILSSNLWERDSNLWGVR